MEEEQELKEMKDVNEFYEFVGYMKATRDIKGVINQMLSGAEIKVIDKVVKHKIYKKAGYTLETFCKHRLGLSEKTIAAYVKFYREFGENFYDEAMQNSIPVNAMEAILRKKDAVDAVKKVEDKEKLKELQIQVEKVQKENEAYKSKHAFVDKWEKTAKKDREEKEAAVKEAEYLKRSLEIAQNGISDDDIRIHNIGKNIKEQFDEIMTYFDYMPLEKKEYSDKTRLEIIGLIEYMMDRLTIIYRIGKDRWDTLHPEDPWMTTIEEDGKRFIQKWGCACLPVEINDDNEA